MIPEIKGHQSGITLLELLIAISLFAVIGAIATLFLNQSMKASEQLETRNETLLSFQTSLILFEQDLTQMLRRSYQSDQEASAERVPPFIGYGEQKNVLLQFVRIGNEVHQPPMLMRYRYEEGRLLRESNVQVDSASEDKWQSMQLISGITEIKMEFFYQGRWQQRWSEDRFVRDQNILPAAVRLNLQHELYGLIYKTVILPKWGNAG